MLIDLMKLYKSDALQTSTQYCKYNALLLLLLYNGTVKLRAVAELQAKIHEAEYISHFMRLCSDYALRFLVFSL